MEKSTKTDSKTSIILQLKNVENNLASYVNLCSTISRSKSDVEAVFIDTSNGKNIDKLNQEKQFVELLEKGKAIVINSDGKTAIGALYAEALSKCSGANAALIENINDVNIGSILSWVSSNKKNIKDELNIGSTQIKSSGNKKSKINVVEFLYNSAIRFFTPLNLHDHSSGVIVVKTESAEVLFENKFAVAKNHLEILHLATCNGNTLNEFALSSESKAKKGFGSVLAVPFTALVLRWRYFISASLSEIKLPAKPSFTNSNHPLYRLSFFVLILLATFLMPYLSQDFGMTWDEKQHNDYSQLAYQWFATMGEDSSAIIDAKGNADFIRQCYRYYGEQSNAIAAIVYNVFDLPPFETRHFIISLYGLLGLIGISLAAKELGGWRAGIIALLFTFFNPGWLGNSMNNPTDIPLASGFAFALYYFIRVLKSLPKPKFALLVWLSIAIGIGIASRIGAFLLIAYFAMFLGINWLSKIRDKEANLGKLIIPYLKIFLTVAILSYIVGILLWPYALTSPLKNPFVAFAKASDNTSFYTNNTELFDGNRLFMREQAPWYYVLKFLSIGNPFYLVLGFGLFVALLGWMKRKINLGLMLLLLFMAIFPVAYAEYANLNYYNGWRHYLFVLPSWIVLAALVFNYLIGSANKIVQYVSLAALLILFIKPTVWIVKNHPNEYVYFNELVGGINGAYGNYELDYYSNSCRAAAEWIARQEPTDTVIVAINNEPLTASYYGHKINPNLNFVWVREYEEDKQEWDYMILTTRTFSKNELINGSFPPKGTVHSIMVDDVPIAAIIKRQNYFMPNGYRTMREQKIDSAIYYFGEAAKWDDRSEEAHRMLGMALLTGNKTDEALIEFDKAIEIYPENFSAYSNKALLYFNKRDYNKCIEFADMAVKFKENVTESYYYAALSYLNLNDPYKAIDKLEKAIGHGGQVPEFYYYLGKAYDMLNKPEQASKAYEACLSVNDKFAQAWQDLAAAYTKLGQTQQAQFALQRLQQLQGGQ